MSGPSKSVQEFADAFHEYADFVEDLIQRPDVPRLKVDVEARFEELRARLEEAGGRAAAEAVEKKRS